MKKKIIIILFLLALATSFFGCGQPASNGPTIAATTLPVWQFASELCTGTDIRVERIITGPVSCVHDYSLSVTQMRTLEQADGVFLSGAGLEHAFMGSLTDRLEHVYDCSSGASLLPGEEPGEYDPHIWLDPTCAADMVSNICQGLISLYPDCKDRFFDNETRLLARLQRLQADGTELLAGLSCRSLITFHDGFSYFARAFDLEILAAMEIETGSEPAASELERIAELIRTQHIPAVFAEANGSRSAADTIARETGASVWILDMAMASEDYFAAMEQNLQVIREALQ